jgi:hypothetical protein
VTAKSVKSIVRPAKRLGLTITPAEVVKGPSIKPELSFDCRSFRLHHAAMNVESHLVSLGSVSEMLNTKEPHFKFHLSSGSVGVDREGENTKEDPCHNTRLSFPNVELSTQPCLMNTALTRA